MMTLLSPLEDFRIRTLGAITGTLARLRYVASLRDEKSIHRHWGLERVHGQDVATAAIRQAHSEVLIEVLRTPLRELAKELAEARNSTDAAGSYLDHLRSRSTLPDGTLKASSLHFNSVLLALSALESAKVGSSHQAA